MNKIVCFYAIGILLLFHSSFCFSQWSISMQDSAYTIDFTGFNASGFSPNPSAGQLGSDRWSITGMSDGILNFIGTQTTVSTDFTRGTSAGGVGTGGIYAFNTGSGNTILGVQPLAADFTPGNFILRASNNTGVTITSFAFKYDIFFLNDQGRSNSLNFSYSTDSINYTALPAENFTTVATADNTPKWDRSKHSIYITGVNIQSSARFYFKWTGDDVGGANSRDEYGIDNLIFIANPSLATANFQCANVCLGDSVKFYDYSSSLTDTVVSWSWNFGNTFSDTLSNPTYLYAVAGSYTVQLVVKDGNNNSDSIQKVIIVNPLPIVGFTVSINNLSVDFTDMSSGNNLSFSWNFGDGNNSTLSNPAHSYSSVGTYTVCLITTSETACIDKACTIITVTSSLGITNSSAKNFVSVFPNPSTGLVFFDYSAKYNDPDAILIVTNILGVTILQKNIFDENPKTIDMSAFPAGIYYLNFSIGSNRQVVKLLKQ